MDRQYERITCADVRVGDRVARTRGGPFLLVYQIGEGNTSRRLYLQHILGDAKAGTIRPRRTAKLWRLSGA